MRHNHDVHEVDACRSWTAISIEIYTSVPDLQFCGRIMCACAENKRVP